MVRNNILSLVAGTATGALIGALLLSSLDKRLILGAVIGAGTSLIIQAASPR